MRDELKALDHFFKPRTVAIIGASRTPSRVGNVILRNFAENGFEGYVYPINPKANEIMGVKVYRSILDVPRRVDLAVIATPAASVPSMIKECVRKRVKACIVISGGFKEVGREDLEKEIMNNIKGSKMRIIGVNCLGVYDTTSEVDTMFFPSFRLKRPDKGGISYVTQSGAVGATTMDWAATQGAGIAKFISYGNATDLDESDFIEYLGNDPATKVIIAYLEGVKDGRKFFKTCKAVAKKKPLVILKAGVSPQGAHAVASHTGSLAGSEKVFTAALKQTGVIQAHNIHELFNYARVLDKLPLPKGKRVQVITDGGGFGVLATDAIYKYGLDMAIPSKATIQEVKSKVPDYVVVGNPMDLIGDADISRYELAIKACAKDPKIDILVVILLYQVPTISSSVVELLTDMARTTDKPIVLISAGGTFTEIHMDYLNEHGIPTFESPEMGVNAISALVKFAQIKD